MNDTASAAGQKDGTVACLLGWALDVIVDAVLEPAKKVKTTAEDLSSLV